EIGIFLGYPLEDVKGFIENKGKNYKTCGLWKVYKDENFAKGIFEKCRRCTSLYCKLKAEGNPLEKIVVAA
ncbi:MAG: DUF3793 family protein, partial [Lachnospiraceae bacterium]|nr:DUF3793 family protein [Lachnospiraceae bacterium]